MGKTGNDREERARALIAALSPDVRARVAWGYAAELQGKFRTWQDYKLWLLACLNAEAERASGGRDRCQAQALALGKRCGLKARIRLGAAFDGGNPEVLLQAAGDRSFARDYGAGFEALRGLFGGRAGQGRPRTTVTGDGAFAVSRRDRAMVVLRLHPEWSTSRIARYVGASESSLESWELWRTARRSLRPARKGRPAEGS